MSCLQVLLPYIDQKMRARAETKGVSARDVKDLSEVEKLFMLAPYHVTLDIFADYAEMIIQVAFFGLDN